MNLSLRCSAVRRRRGTGGSTRIPTCRGPEESRQGKQAQHARSKGGVSLDPWVCSAVLHAISQPSVHFLLPSPLESVDLFKQTLTRRSRLGSIANLIFSCTCNFIACERAVKYQLSLSPRLPLCLSRFCSFSSCWAQLATDLWRSAPSLSRQL